MDNKIFELMEKGSKFDDVTHELHNRQTKVEAGAMLYNLDGEKLIIVRKLNPIEASGLTSNEMSMHRYYEVQFIVTGNKHIARADHIKNGHLKNCRTGSVYGKGIIGTVDIQSHKAEYTLWTNMLKRCYNDATHKVQPFYANVSVCARWLSLENFIEDLPSLANYNMWRNGAGWELDKDLLAKDGVKVYSKETCMFISKKDNAKMGGKNGKKKSA